jgi:hypothetical protein
LKSGADLFELARALVDVHVKAALMQCDGGSEPADPSTDDRDPLRSPCTCLRHELLCL